MGKYAMIYLCQTRPKPFLISDKDGKLIPDKKNLLILNSKKDLSKERICQVHL